MKSSQRSPFLTALFHPANLAMLAVIAAASLCAAWWLLPLGLVLWLVMFLIVSQNPALRFANRIGRREPLAQRFQTRFDRLQSSQLTLYSNLMKTKGTIRGALKPVQHAINRIADQAYQLSRRMSALENHLLVSRTYRDPEAELKQLNEKATGASDSAVINDYEAARRTLEGQVVSMKSILELLNRFEVQLSTLVNVLEGCVTSVIRLQASEGSSLQQEIQSILKSIQDQKQQLDEFESQVAGLKTL